MRPCLIAVKFYGFVRFLPTPNGGDEEDRTPDPLRARQVLSQLSYTPMSRQVPIHNSILICKCQLFAQIFLTFFCKVAFVRKNVDFVVKYSIFLLFLGQKVNFTATVWANVTVAVGASRTAQLLTFIAFATI